MFLICKELLVPPPFSRPSLPQQMVGGGRSQSTPPKALFRLPHHGCVMRGGLSSELTMAIININPKRDGGVPEQSQNSGKERVRRCLKAIRQALVA